MIGQICAELKNYFVKPDEDLHYGTWRIENGRLAGDDLSAASLQQNQYFRIVGSVFNDGVHKVGDELIDETFEGAVWAMRVPPAIIALAAEIEAWEAENAEALSSPYQSESFGGYSYSLKSGASSDGGSGSVTWRTQFGSRLNKWRRLSVL